jgi:hypothetical protein
MVGNLRSSIDVLKQAVRFNLDLLHKSEKKLKSALKNLFQREGPKN